MHDPVPPEGSAQKPSSQTSPVWHGLSMPQPMTQSPSTHTRPSPHSVLKRQSSSTQVPSTQEKPLSQSPAPVHSGGGGGGTQRPSRHSRSSSHITSGLRQSVPGWSDRRRLVGRDAPAVAAHGAVDAVVVALAAGGHAAEIGADLAGRALEVSAADRAVGRLHLATAHAVAVVAAGVVAVVVLLRAAPERGHGREGNERSERQASMEHVVPFSRSDNERTGRADDLPDSCQPPHSGGSRTIRAHRQRWFTPAAASLVNDLAHGLGCAPCSDGRLSRRS